MTVVEFLNRNPEIGLTVSGVTIHLNKSWKTCQLSIDPEDGLLSLSDVDNLIAALTAVKLAVQE